MKPQGLDSRIFRFVKNICIAVLVSGAAILFYSCENDLEQIKAFSSPENLPVVVATNFESLFTDSGKVRYTLKTPKLLRFRIEGKEFVEFPDGMEMVQYNAKQEVTSSLKADYAKQFVKEEKWEAKNNVVATNMKGDTLKTEHLIWEEKTEQIYTEEYVEIIRPDGIYTGIGLTSDESLNNWKIKKLKGIIYVTVKEDDKEGEDSSYIQPDLKDQKDKPFSGPLKLKE